MGGPDGSPQVFLRPLATPLPLGFMALAATTSVFAVVELGWIPADQRQTAAWMALVVAAPLQLLAAVFGYLARDPIAGSSMAFLSGTWALLGPNRNKPAERSSSAANTLGESGRGRHSHSTDPSGATRQLCSQLDSNPYAAIGGKLLIGARPPGIPD